jgi:DNA polymerase III epsilon subunit-like protein
MQNDFTDSGYAVNRRTRRVEIKSAAKRMRRGASGLAERFDPNAIDGDNDGFVQDDSPIFRRPAVSKPSISSGRKDETFENLDPELAQKMRKHQAADYKIGDKSELDGKPIAPSRADWLRGLTPRQIARLVTPSNEDEAWEFFKNSRMKHLSGGKMENQAKLLFNAVMDSPEKQIDFSDSAITEMRNIIEKTLDESPSFRWAVSNYGMPMVFKRTKDAQDAYIKLPEQQAYIEDIKKRRPDLQDGDIDPPLATSYGNLRATFFSNEIGDSYKFGEPGYLTPGNMAVIDDTLGGFLRHEWGHFFLSSLLEDDEMPTNSRLFNSQNSYKQKQIAEKYNIEKPLAKNLQEGSPDKTLPWARSAYAHTSMSEMFAEGVAAFFHPTPEVRHYALNSVLSRDIENALDIEENDSPWTRMPAGLSSGRRKSRRENPDQLRLEMTIPSSSEQTTETNKPEERPKPPFKPRPPDNGPFTGKFIQLFKGVQTFQEFKDRYDSMEIIFFDYETTGLTDDDRPVQMGAVKMKGGKVIDRFNVYINPGRELSKWSKENLKNANGDPLTQEWADQQMSIKEAHAQFVAWAGQNPLLGGQYTPFDLRHLERSMKDNGIKFTYAGVIDSKSVADEVVRKWTPENPVGPFQIDPDSGKPFASNSLGPLAEFLGVDMGGGWHSADVDAETSGLIISRMLEAAIADSTTPKQLLDVDGIPKRQDVKRQRYAKQMAEYPQKFAEYEKKLAEFEARKVAGLSSGNIKRVGKVSSSPASTVSGKRRVYESRRLKERDTLVPVYDVDGKKIAFGVDSVDDREVETLPINPFRITNTSPESKEGREYAALWFDATVGQMEEDQSNQGITSALLYAASRGDGDARRELLRLAEIGKKKMAEAKAKRRENTRSLRGETPEDRKSPEWWISNAPGATISEKSPQDEWTRLPQRPLEIKDMYLVHETSYTPQTDEEGNYVLRPTEDYVAVDPKTGKPRIDELTGEAMEAHRGSIHFAINHPVGGHMYRQTPTDGTYLVLIPLQAMLDSNPDALDNLYAVDSWLTPKPGEGLKLPKGVARVVKVPGTSDFGVTRPEGNPLIDWTPEQTKEVQDAIAKVSEERKKIFSETLKEISREHTRNPNYDPKEFPAGESSSSDDIDVRVADIARSLGVTSSTHDGSAQEQIENISRNHEFNNISNIFKESERWGLFQLSENAKMRIANKSRFTTSDRDKSRNDEPESSGDF